MAWKTVRRSRGRPASISIRKTGQIAWNLTTQEALGNPEFVQLLHDGEAKRLGLRGVTEDTEDRYKVQAAKKQNTFSISAKPDLRDLGLLVETAYRRDIQTEDDIVFIDLSEIGESQVQTTKRRRSKK